MTRFPASSAARARLDRVADHEFFARDAGTHQALARALHIHVGQSLDVEVRKSPIARRERDPELTDPDDTGANGAFCSGGKQGLIVHVLIRRSIGIAESDSILMHYGTDERMDQGAIEADAPMIWNRWDAQRPYDGAIAVYRGQTASRLPALDIGVTAVGAPRKTA